VAERRRLGSRPRRARLGAAASGLLLAADLVLWNHAIAAVGAGIATVLANLQVLFVAVIAWLLLGERPSRAYLAALPVVLCGVVLVAGVASHPPGGHPLAGIGYGVTGSLAYGGFLLGLRQSSAGLRHVAGPLADTTAGAALGCLLIGLAAGGLWPLPGWASLAWLLLLAVTSQTLGWLAITASLPRLPAALSALLLLLQPAASLVLAAVILGQIPDPPQDFGAVLVCGGVLAASWPGRRAGGP
jgi:drug/metabolite transporter (DMT)-like permease